MKTDIWMPLYIGDYLRDTMGLSAQEHGAYLLLLMRCWTDKQLADDTEELLATTRLDSRETLNKILSRYFYRNGNGWRHKRVDQELARRNHLSTIGRKGGQSNSERKAEAAKKNAKRGGRPRNPTINLSENPTETQAPHSHSHSHSQSHSQSDKDIAPSAAILATSARPVYHLLLNAFLAKNNDSGFDFKREGPHIKQLEKKALIRAGPPPPEEFCKMLLVTFWQLIHSEDKFWKAQPFLPSVLNSGGIYPRVLKAAENLRTENSLSQEQEQLIRGMFHDP